MYLISGSTADETRAEKYTSRATEINKFVKNVADLRSFGLFCGQAFTKCRDTGMRYSIL